VRLLFALALVVLALRLAALGRGVLGDVWGTRLTAGAVRGRR